MNFASELKKAYDREPSIFLAIGKSLDGFSNTRQW